MDLPFNLTVHHPGWGRTGVGMLSVKLYHKSIYGFKESSLIVEEWIRRYTALFIPSFQSPQLLAQGISDGYFPHISHIPGH